MPAPLFPIDPDWTEPVRETLQYRTDIMPANDGTEQRVRLRKRPRLQIAYRLVTLDARGTAALHALLWGNSKFSAPLWQDAQPLLEDAGPGSGSLAVDTTHRRFAVGGLAAIWRDQFTHEIVTIDGVADDELGLDGVTALDWKADGQTIVFPVRAGIIDPATVGIIGPTAAQSTVSFLCEAS